MKNSIVLGTSLEGERRMNRYEVVKTEFFLLRTWLEGKTGGKEIVFRFQ